MKDTRPDDLQGFLKLHYYRIHARERALTVVLLGHQLSLPDLIPELGVFPNICLPFPFQARTALPFPSPNT